MPRNAFAQISKITNCAGRIDYISNPDRQEHLFTTYSTVDDDSYWTELAQVCHAEHDKYGAGGKVIEAREWIIALDESLLELDPDMVIRQFVDAFHNKYGVECKAALHHNSKQTNYHIHMIFSERQLLEQPIEKVATRNMFFDENGKHKRTKKEILDAEGNVREGCKIIAKGEVYERQKFTGKNPIFKTVAFKKEAQELFKNINNSLITDEDRKLSIFNPESVYLATKKIGKNNPMAEYIIADNEERKEWNRSVDQALIALVDRNDILAVKHNSIQDEVKKSIAENGNVPGMFAGVVKKAVAIIKDMVQKAYEKMEAVTQSVETVAPDTKPSVNKEVKPIRIPPKPQPPSGIDNLEHLQAVFNKIKRYGGKIRANEKTIEALEKAAGTYTSIFQALDKIQLERDIKKLKAENEGAHLMQENIIRQYGYTTVDAFMMLYWNTKNAKDTYEKKLSDWTAKYGNLSDGEVAKEIGISHRISDAKNRVKQQTISEPAKQKKRSERTDR